MVGEKRNNSSIDDVVFSWKRKDFEDIVNVFGLVLDWEPEYPAAGSIVSKPLAKK